MEALEGNHGAEGYARGQTDADRTSEDIRTRMMSELERLRHEKSRIGALAERVGAVDIRTYESLPPERVAGDLAPVVAEILGDALGLVDSIVKAHEAIEARSSARGGGLGEPHLPFEAAIDAAVGLEGATLQAVGDIAFLAHLELQQRAERLARVRSHARPLAIVEECDSALRRVRKALASADVAMARAGIGPPVLDFTSELECSLRVRRGCAKLRRRILAPGEPTPSTIVANLRSAGTAIAMMVGWDIYPAMRVRDRLQLRDLQRRILEWLRDERDPVGGTRLWQDLVGFLRMLSQINRRQELLAHDAQALGRLVVLLRQGGGAAHEDVPPLLASLEGLDDELDDLAAGSDDAALGRAVWRLASSFDVAKSPD